MNLNKSIRLFLVFFGGANPTHKGVLTKCGL